MTSRCTTSGAAIITQKPASLPSWRSTQAG
ncbi:Uncharacterised protein [Bordetella pertussis]|nr:Uncharacterised protein [Bordetella pertussis]